ncbi:MAG: FecR family protein, partial [candidate division NC10 bacterium]
MNMLKRIVNTALLFAMLAPIPAWAQQAAGSSIGTVTALQGQATVGRAALPQPTPMKFRDDVFFRDQITTKEQSTLRLLLGGKGVLTIREQSQVTLDESVAPTGERRSVLSLLGGKIAAAVARSLMRPGEEVEVRTPNAVAAVRGTVLIAEYTPPQTRAEGPKPILLASGDPNFRVAQAPGGGGTSTFLVLTGSVIITAQGVPPVTVGAMQTVSISVGPAGAVQVGAVQTATQAQVNQATQGFQMEKSISGEGDGGKAAQAQAQVATTLATAIVQATSDASTPPPPPPPAQQPSTSPVPDVVEIPPLKPTMVQNDLPSGPLLQLNALTMTVSAGTTVMKFGPGSPNTVVPFAKTGTGMVEPPGEPLPAAGTFDILGTTITHSGPLLGLNAATLGTNDYTTPLMQVNGTVLTVTASGTTGALATVEGGSRLYTGGPMFVLTGGGTVNLTGAALNISGNGDVYSAVYSGSSLFNIQGKSTMKTSDGPLVRITNGALIASDFGSSDGTGNQITIGGGMLDATNSFIELTGRPNQSSGTDVVTMAQPAGVPQVKLTSS